MRKILIGVSGASGAGYFTELLQALNSVSDHHDMEINVIYNDTSEKILLQEKGIEMSDLQGMANSFIHHSKMDSPAASGSNVFDHMIICPCSTSTVGKVHSGISDNLMTRCAQVAMKEKRDLILVIRETPLSTPILKAMFELSSWGVTIMPASPPFYDMKDPTGKDLQRNLAGRMLDLIGLKNDITTRYGPGER